VRWLRAAPPNATEANGESTQEIDPIVTRARDLAIAEKLVACAVEIKVVVAELCSLVVHGGFSLINSKRFGKWVWAEKLIRGMSAELPNPVCIL